ncbi:protein O-mannose kinase-like isoform X1 [Dinothrombium tinctorium]|uniref:Protein O-mannose kinase-like isoform X1 n=1 Tax=Dinothrombium tinctorium TaxID=1965070 RepID=A0A3S3RZ89_9ACAR|nr:protein O-mannose kinase-like isoform X1 [Dinothrombium tinctorium]
MKDIATISLLNDGVVKIVYLAKWKFTYITVSKLRHSSLQEDFNHNLLMLKSLSNSNQVTELYGYCNNTYLITKYYPYGDALNVPILLNNMPSRSKCDICFKFCVSYAEVINYLHSSPIGVRVMCDANSLQKLLSQFLITNSLTLVANDLDALPLVDDNGIKCGKREIKGTFAAPEQLWPFPNETFDDEKMPFYDEKVDIWKMPDVCLWFLSFCSNQRLIDHLDSIHSRCKSKEPRKRPSAREVLEHYKAAAFIFKMNLN